MCWKCWPWPTAEGNTLRTLLAIIVLSLLPLSAMATEAQREAIVLRKLEELSFREIGERLGRSEDASRMLFGRAMAALTLALPEIP